LHFEAKTKFNLIHILKAEKKKLSGAAFLPPAARGARFLFWSREKADPVFRASNRLNTRMQWVSTSTQEGGQGQIVECEG
jgi:hypothetical protein